MYAATTLLLTLLAPTLLCASSLSCQDKVNGHLLNFTANGAWSWFEDERAIVDPLRGRIMISSVANASGVEGLARDGNIDLAWLDLSPGRFGSHVFHAGLEADDHNSAALLVRDDGRYLAMYGMHGNGPSSEIRKSRWRVSDLAGDPNSWTAEASYLHPVFMSYSNVFHLTDTDRTYNFVRAINFDPNVMVSTDHGSTWSGGGKLLTYGGASDRPYAKYASNGSNRIDVLTTQTHPRNLNTSIYHGYVQNDQLFDSAGQLVDANVLDGSGVSPSQLTTVFAANTLSFGVSMQRCWTIDMAVDPDGTTRTLFQARANGSSNDHRLFFATLTNGIWGWHEVCKLGGFLYAQENDYTGLAALHPDQPNTIFVSTTVDPQTGASTPHYEIYRGTTANGGATWSWSPITEDSSCDNLRPIAPAWDEQRTALIWLRGTYSTYTNYDLAVVGVLDAPELTLLPATYHDATLANTTLANSLFLNPTGPSASQGSNDNRWHQRSGFGNGNGVLTASETGSENAPVMRTRVAGLASGRVYDVYVNFWSNPAEDWRVRAGFSVADLRVFAKQGAARAEASHFSNPVVTTSGSQTLYSVWLGRARANILNELWIYIDDENSGQSAATRTWYDGVSVRAVDAAAAASSAGQGCNGNQLLQASSLPELGTSVSTGLVDAPANSFAAMQFGFGDLTPLPLGLIGFPECTLYVDSIASVSFGLVNAAGNSPTIAVPIPNFLSLHGQRFGLQGWSLTATSLHMTPAVVWMPGW